MEVFRSSWFAIKSVIIDSHKKVALTIFIEHRNACLDFMSFDHLTIAVELIRRVEASNPDVVVLCMNYQSIRAEAEVIDIEQLCLKCALIKNIDAFTGTEPNVAIVVDGDVVDEVTCQYSWGVEIGAKHTDAVPIIAT